jgi:hypothetical protein
MSYMTSLQEQFGGIDIYLFDQILRGNISPGMVIFDAGCGPDGISSTCSGRVTKFSARIPILTSSTRCGDWRVACRRRTSVWNPSKRTRIQISLRCRHLQRCPPLRPR